MQRLFLLDRASTNVSGGSAAEEDDDAGEEEASESEEFEDDEEVEIPAEFKKPSEPMPFKDCAAPQPGDTTRWSPEYASLSSLGQSAYGCPEVATASPLGCT